MLYAVTIEGRERQVEVTISASGGVRVTLDGEAVDADVSRVPGGARILIGGVVHDVAFGGPSDSRQLAVGPNRARADVLSERAKAKRAKRSGGAGGGDVLVAPMPGRVVALLVEKGQRVEVGTPAAVIEAMKMENELLAPCAGAVLEIHVSEGASVEGRAKLISFTPDPEG